MKTVKLGDVCDFKARANSELLPFIGMEDVESNTGKFLGSMKPRTVKSSTSYFDETCVLYGKLRPYLNKVFVPDFEGHCSTEFLAIRPDLKKLDRKYLWHFLISPKTVDTLNSYTTGTRMPRADISILKSLEISLPSLEEQRRVVERLDAAFEKIDRAIKQTEKNIINDKCLFSSLLENKFTLASSKTHTIGEVCTIKGGKRMPRGKMLTKQRTEHPYIRVADFDHKGGVNASDIRFVPNDVWPSISNYIITDNDVFLSIAGSIGITGIVPEALNGANLTENACRMIPDDKILNKKYLYYFTVTSLFMVQAKNGTRTTAQPKLALARIRDIQLPVPTLPEQADMVMFFDQIHERIEKLVRYHNEKLAYLTALKQSLLTQAFSQSEVE